MVWKPSPRTPLAAIAVQKIVDEVARANNCAGVFSLCVGGADDIGERMLADNRLPLISATGSCGMGRRVAEVVGRRLGRTILELGGNNAIVITPSADLELAVRATAFAAVGTAGQRCTTARRLIVHKSIHDNVVERLTRDLSPGADRRPLGRQRADGPADRRACRRNDDGRSRCRCGQGGKIIHGGKRLPRPGFFVEPALGPGQRQRCRSSARKPSPRSST